MYNAFNGLVPHGKVLLYVCQRKGRKTDLLLMDMCSVHLCLLDWIRASPHDEDTIRQTLRALQKVKLN